MTFKVDEYMLRIKRSINGIPIRAMVAGMPGQRALVVGLKAEIK